MKRQFLTLQKAISLEEAGGILSRIETEYDTVFIIGNSTKEEDENIEFTEMLQELCELNKKRREILEQFKLAKTNK